MSEYIVFGLGRFGRSLATEIQSLDNEVIGVDVDRQKVQETSGTIRQAIEADATSEATLRELGVSNLDAAVVAIGDPEPSIMVTVLLKKLDVSYVIARATSELHGEILRLVGADRVVFPEQETAIRLAHGIAVPETVDYLSISSDMGISKLSVPRHLVGLSHGEASIESRFHVRIIAIIRRDRVLFGASVGEKFEPRDVLIVSGRDQDLRELSQFAGETKE
jgi:trk system potassium uptake protein